jgi:hypothetical protein
VCIFAGIDPRSMIHHMGITSLSGIVLITTSRDDDREYAHHLSYTMSMHTLDGPRQRHLGCSPRTSGGRGILPAPTGWVHRDLRRRGCIMAATSRLSRWRRFLNALVQGLLRVGLGPRHTYLLTVRGRRSGIEYSTSVTLVEQEDKRWARRTLWRGRLGAQCPSRGRGDAQPRPPI